jgi:hypothetical protein
MTATAQPLNVQRLRVVRMVRLYASLRATRAATSWTHQIASQQSLIDSGARPWFLGVPRLPLSQPFIHCQAIASDVCRIVGLALFWVGIAPPAFSRQPSFGIESRPFKRMSEHTRSALACRAIGVARLWVEVAKRLADTASAAFLHAVWEHSCSAGRMKTRPAAVGATTLRGGSADFACLIHIPIVHGHFEYVVTSTEVRA